METEDEDRAVLLVEEDPRAADRVQGALREGGVAARCVGSPARARAELRDRNFAAVLVDVGLPDGTGYELAGFVRRHRPDLPLLLLARSCDRDGFLHVGEGDSEPGSTIHDDLPIVAEQVKNLIRHDGSPRSATVRCGPLRIDRIRREATCHGTRLALTPIEYRLLEALVAGGTDGATTEALQDAGWDRARPESSNVLAVHIAHIRRKLEDAGSDVTIECLRGYGYGIRCPRAPEPGFRRRPRRPAAENSTRTTP